MPADNPGWTELHQAAHSGSLEEVGRLLACVDDTRSSSEASSSASGHPWSADRKGDTPLHAAAHCGHTAVVEALLRAGGDLDGQNEAGDTALIAASEGGHQETVQSLLHRGASALKVTSSGASALFFASLRGHTGVACALLAAQAPVDHMDAAGLTPLWVAAWKGRAETARVLLEAGADITVEADVCGRQDAAEHASQRMTPLVVAAHGGHVQTVELLLLWRGLLAERGRNDSGRNLSGAGSLRELDVALSLSARLGHTEVVNLLLQAGANPNSEVVSGRLSVLQCAAEEGHAAVVALLLEAGAGVGRAPAQNPFVRAITNGHPQVVQILAGSVSLREFQHSVDSDPLVFAAQQGELSCVKALLDAGASVDPLIKRMPSALMAASLGNRLAIVSLLLSYGATVDAVDITGQSSLHLACVAGHTPIVKALITADSPINLMDAMGVTPLAGAAREGHQACCRLLLDSGADPFGGDSVESCSALDYAAAHAHTAVVEMLLEQAHGVVDVISGQKLYFGLSKPLVSAAENNQEAVCHRLLDLISEEELSEALTLAATAARGAHPLHQIMATWAVGKRGDAKSLEEGIPEVLAAAVNSVSRERDGLVRENKRLRSGVQ